MNIQEAVKKAMESGGVIRRNSIYGGRSPEELYVAIKFSHVRDTCTVCIYLNNRVERSCRHWEPTAGDLIADDWEVLR